MPLEGKRLGPYRLLHLLGSGGMGEVYLAEDARIGQQVAIKVIRSEGIAYPENESAKEAARLFEREAKAIARLDHPNILPLYAYGEEILGEQQLTYLVMPYRKEGTLATWLRLRGNAVPLSPAEVAPLLQQAAAALQHAHNQHVLHQDIKPTNFLIRLREDHPDRPDLLLADFGIAKLTSATASASQSIRGTPIYMAPEQWDGHPVAATDQYALAIMVYELLVGRPPFQGGPGQVMRQHYQTPPPTPSTLNPRLSPALDAVLLRALSKEPNERFSSVIAFAHAFQEAVQSNGELQATLAIGWAEAQTGSIRRLTLPGGRQVSVTIPAGVGSGTILRLEGQGMPYYQGGPTGSLVLTITITSEEHSPPKQQGDEGPTALMSSEIILDGPEQVVAETAKPFSHTDPSETKKRQYIRATPPSSPSQGAAGFSPIPFLRKVALLVVVILLLAISGLVAFRVVSVHNASVAATATANAGAIALAQGKATATAQARATATAQAVATATAEQQIYAQATSGTPALNDPLSDDRGSWGIFTTTWGGQCAFTGGAYHLSLKYSSYVLVCTSADMGTLTNSANFALQVQISIVQGNIGGFYFGNTQNNSYGVLVNSSGVYSLYQWTKSDGFHTFLSASNPAIKDGLNQVNMFTAIVNNGYLYLYANAQFITSSYLSAYNQGGGGLIAESPNQPTNVAFSNLKIWTL